MNIVVSQDHGHQEHSQENQLWLVDRLVVIRQPHKVDIMYSNDILKALDRSLQVKKSSFNEQEMRDLRWQNS